METRHLQILILNVEIVPKLILCTNPIDLTDQSEKTKNSADSDQSVPIGAVCTGSTMFTI